ncbi:MAG TPA: zinc finger protein [Actinomycetota bacterium]|nr:zinc finger protein [Actinomycetota bacterium]
MSVNELHAPEKLRCPSCGAKNPPDAQWCGQCLERFDAPPPPPPVAEPPAREPAGDRPQVKPGVERGSFRSTEDGILWRCSSCDTENRLEEQTCTICGTPFAESIRPPAPARAPRDPGTTAMISLFFPGAGHAYLGMWAQAAARAVVSAWVVLMALFFAVGGDGRSMPVAALYGAAAFALWVTAAHDAFREANGETKQVLLQGRRFTYLVLGLLMLLLASLFLTAFANR